MKFLFAIFFFSLTAFAQTDSLQYQNVSVISAEKLNVVYRGIDNPIRIIYPGAASISVAAPGIRKGIGDGNYILIPGSGNEVIINVTAKMPDGTSRVEKKSFRILGLPAPYTLINNHSGLEGVLYLSKEALRKAVIKVRIDVLLFENDFDISNFSISIKGKTYYTKGDKITDEIYNKIAKLKKGSEIVISFVKPKAWDSPNYMLQSRITGNYNLNRLI